MLKKLFFTVGIFCCCLTAKADIVNEIIDGCTAKASVLGMCITISPIYTTTVSIALPTEMTHKSKIVYQAKSDAATFVATQGAIKGIYLESALDFLRKLSNQYKTQDDLSLAKAILAFQGTTKRQ